MLLESYHLTLSFDDVKTNLLAKDKFDTEIHSESSGEGLVVRGRNQEKGRNNKYKSRLKSRGKNSKYCHYCKKKGHKISECYSLKNRQDKEDKGNGKQPEKSVEASIVETELDGDCFVASNTEQRSKK